MGGDEVYPTALRDDYIAKMRLPYSYALPDTKPSPRIPMLLLPGNHDWYDGLVNFLAMFCREKPTSIGAWRTSQRRSYFAAKLTTSGGFGASTLRLYATWTNPRRTISWP